ncbi:MAG: ferrous iron transport protein A [Spirochaetaceae bacterium]|jgi:Fe2+ transport system protein FeoA|nr:ferrous iron transport protein A [Spirochaetaceae bacterium]
MFLDKSPRGAAFRIIRLNLSKETGKRLADMGFIEGVCGVVIRKSFLGGPMQARVMDYDVLIRRFEAHGIEIELCDQKEAS